jgi:catechol 2,3-dioxygenase-like lactoylglutathione lyase family enzyme
MKKYFLFGLLIFIMISASTTKPDSMQLNAGIITHKIKETKSFYCEKLGFSVVFENDWFILLQAPNSNDRISFLQPKHPSQQPIFQPAFEGKGVYFTLEVDNLADWYQKIKSKGIKLKPGKNPGEILILPFTIPMEWVLIL